MEEFKLNAEQKEFLLLKTLQEVQEFCEVVVSQNTEKVTQILEDPRILSSIEQSFLIRYGNKEMKELYVKYYGPSTSLLIDWLKYETDEELLTSIVLEYIEENTTIPLTVLGQCLDKCNAGKILSNLRYSVSSDDYVSSVEKIIKERNNDFELALFYAYSYSSAPDGFWDNPQYINEVAKHPEFFIYITSDTLLSLLPHTNLCRAIAQQAEAQEADIWKTFNAEMLITMFNKDDYSLAEITECATQSKFNNEDLEKLYQCDTNLFSSIIKVADIDWISLLNHQISAEAMKIIINNRLTFNVVTAYCFHIMKSEHVELLLKTIISNKNLWEDSIIGRMINQGHDEYVLMWLQKINSETSFLKEYESNIISSSSYDCVEYLISKFGLQDTKNEIYFKDIKLRTDREKLIYLYQEKYGFKSKEGKKIWSEYQKQHTADLSLCQKLKILFN